MLPLKAVLNFCGAASDPDTTTSTTLEATIALNGIICKKIL